MWDDTTTGNGCLDQGIQFFVTTNGQLQMPGGDTLDLQIFASVTCQLQYLGCEVLKNSRGVNSGSGTDALAVLNGSFEETVDTTNGELKTGFGRTGLRCFLCGGGLTALASFSSLASFSRLSSLEWWLRNDKEDRVRIQQLGRFIAPDFKQALAFHYHKKRAKKIKTWLDRNSIQRDDSFVLFELEQEESATAYPCAVMSHEGR